MKNPHIFIITSICEWYGVNPQEILSAPTEVITGKKIKEKQRLMPEQKAWAMICGVLTNYGLHDLMFEEAALAEYFKRTVDQVKKGKNQHAFLLCSSQSHVIIHNKIWDLITNQIQKLYEQHES
ncbi:MAG: hypothetical protein JNK73_13035 [Bacteroidia bacterium]|nr:hypothetical protein [Bacteroidia bacterium]